MRSTPPLAVLPHERPAWRLVHKAALAAGASQLGAREQAWGAVREARLSAPVGLPVLKAADAAFRIVSRILRIKASPPTYEITVTSIADLLISEWSTNAVPLVADAINELADIADSDKPAAAKWQQGKKKVGDLADALTAAGEAFSETERQRLGRMLAVAYRLGQEEIAEPLGFSVDFSLADRDAIHALHNSGLYWVGKHYGEAFDQDKALAIVREVMLEKGLGRVEAGKALAAHFGGELKKNDTYWQGLAATMATRSRSFGAIESMRQTGVRRYEFVNPDDEVTSDVCRALNGRIFTVRGAIELRDKLLDATSPEAWKELSPWPKAEDLSAPDDSPLDGAALLAKGIAWPPLHFHCRSSIDVAVWMDLEEDDVDPLGDVEPSPYVPPKKKPKPAPPVVEDAIPQPVLPPEGIALPEVPVGLTPAQTVEDLGARGVIDAGAAYDWTPPLPSLEAVTTSKGLRAYLEAAGYDAEEVVLLTQPGALPSVLQATAREAAELELEAATTQAWQQTRAVTWLQQRPPRRVAAAPALPADMLSPEDLGLRLHPSAEEVPDYDLGQVHRDVVDGTTWYVRFAPGGERQARQEVAANALYRRLGLDAPTTRVIILPDGRVGTATPTWAGWQQPTTLEDLVVTHGDELARAMPADAWMANWNTFGQGNTKVWRRENTIPGIGTGTLRTDNVGVFDFRATGGGKPFADDKVPELAVFLSDAAPRARLAYQRAEVDRGLLLPMMERIGAVTPAEIDRALKVSGLDAADAERLREALLGRAAVMRQEAATLRAELREAAAARAEAARAAAAARAAGQAQREALRRRLEAGDLPEGFILDGVDLELLERHLTRAPGVAVQSDHGVVRDQTLCVSRYRAMRDGKVEHEGYEIKAVIDTTAFDRIQAGMARMARTRGATSGTNYRSWARVGFGTAQDTAASPELMVDLATESAFLGPGAWVETDTVSIDFGGATAKPSCRGLIRVRIKRTGGRQAQAEVDAVLRELGIGQAFDAPSAEASEAMALNKVLWNVQGHRYLAKSEGQVLDVAKARAELAREKVKLDTIERVALSSRGYHTWRITGRWKGYRAQHKVRYLYHEMATRDSVAASISAADGSPGGLLSTVTRTQHGVVISGASSGADLDRGPGGAHVFLRLVSEENQAPGGGQHDWYGSFGAWKALVHPRALDRVDWYHNNHDAYGALSQGREAAADAIAALSRRASSNSHEIMVRHEVPRSDVLMWAASGRSERDHLLRALRAAGVREWNGYPIDEMVVVMARPGDYSGLKPGNAIHDFVRGARDDLPDGVMPDAQPIP